jgi:sodium transport system permease protein
MKDILTILKKELYRVFHNKSLLITAFILPGLLLYVIYSIMGSALMNTENKQNVYFVNAPAVITDSLKDVVNIKNGTSLNNYNEVVKKKEYELIVVFDDDFDDKVGSTIHPTITYYYDSSYMPSINVKTIVDAYVNAYRAAILESLYTDITLFDEVNIDITGDTEKGTELLLMSSMLPMLIITFLFQGVMSFAPESFAGEKERGTINTLLSTPVKRSSIAFGKVLALSIMGTLSALSSFIAIILSLPKMLGNTGMSSVYGVNDYLLILVILISTILVIVALLSIISTYAKNVQEASTMSLPVMILSLVVGLSTMLTNGSVSNNLLYLIPIFNSSQILYQIFTLDVNIIQFIITIISNVVVAVLLIYIIPKLLNNEKVMFKK